MTMAADFEALLNSRSRSLRYLLFIDAAVEFRICSGLDVIVHGGETYTPRGWKPGPIRGGDPSTAGFACTIEDIEGDLELRAYSDGWTNAEATLYILAKEDAKAEYVTAWQPMTGVISAASGGHTFMNLSVSGGVGLGSRAGLQVGDSLCRLVYKGARCKDASAELTCARTFVACAARTGGDNTANFRGARRAPEAGTVLHLGPAGATIPSAPPPPNPWPEDWRVRHEMFEMPEPPISTNGGPAGEIPEHGDEGPGGGSYASGGAAGSTAS